MRLNYICRLSLLQHRATATLKSMNPHTFSNIHITQFIIYYPRQDVCVLHRRSLSFHTICRHSILAKFILITGINHIPNSIYRKYRQSNTDTRIPVYMNTEDTDIDNTAVILKGYPIRH